MSTQVQEAPKKRSTAAERVRAMKESRNITSVSNTEKTSSTRLTEADKALDTNIYILNTITDKYVKRTSIAGQKILAGETPEKSYTSSEILTNVVTVLQQIAPNVLTNAIIKSAISQIAGIPRSFPSEWGGRGKKPRPDGKPKGTQNAYIIFATEMRSKVKNDNPTVPNSAPKGKTSITTIIGKLWEELTDRSDYENRAKLDFERYEKEMDVWEKENPEYARKATSVKKITRTNGHRVFCEANKEEYKTNNPDKNGREINSLLAKTWSSFNENEKLPFNKIAEEQNASLSPKQEKTTKLSAVEEKKKNDPDNYILNGTGRYVSINSKAGKKVVRLLNKETDVDADLLE